MFLAASFLDVLSHSLKECVVRSQPLDQEKFNFKIAVSQFLVGLLITPFVLQVSKWKDDYSGTPLADQASISLFEFMVKYFSLGLQCVFAIKKDSIDGIEHDYC